MKNYAFFFFLSYNLSLSPPHPSKCVDYNGSQVRSDFGSSRRNHWTKGTFTELFLTQLHQSLFSSRQYVYNTNSENQTGVILANPKGLVWSYCFKWDFTTWELSSVNCLVYTGIKILSPDVGFNYTQIYHFHIYNFPLVLKFHHKMGRVIQTLFLYLEFNM